jgi:ADP-ribosylglycohydrolase
VPTLGERALAALYGLAIGDALGMPTQLLSSPEVAARFGRIDGFRAAEPDHRLAPGLPAGTVTDDTEQALLLAGLLIEGSGHVAPDRFAARLVAWEETMRAKGSLDLLGPSTQAAVAAIAAGTPVAAAGRSGTTNGAAMRVTPVGLVMNSTDLVALVDRVEETTLISHHTGVAIAGAAAVAAAVSAGIDGASTEDQVAVALAAAALGERRGSWVAGASVSRRIEWAVSLADPADPGHSLAELEALIGTSLATQESVPTAFGIWATFPDQPWAAVLAAANLGGDSDTIGAMVGAMAGAGQGLSGFPESARATVTEVNSLDLESIATALLALRTVGSGSADWT